MADEEMIDLVELTRALCVVAHKAARVARAIRSDAALLRLLIDRKRAKSKGNHVIDDFKTLADVLIQQLAVRTLCEQFPRLEGRIQGEENQVLVGNSGEAIDIKIFAREKDTAKLLHRVLGRSDEHRESAASLARIVHSELESFPETEVFGCPPQPVNADDLGVWIDPIDATSAYIDGGRPSEDSHMPAGLQVATVLIGAYSRRTGLPLTGVIAQPFWVLECKDVDAGLPDGDVDRSVRRQDTLVKCGLYDQWCGRVFWGIADAHVHGCLDDDMQPIAEPYENLPDAPVLLSKHAGQETRDALASVPTSPAPGCGSKILCVIRGLAMASYVSMPTTFKWDTCAGHAILRAMGGDMVKFDNPDMPLLYHQPDRATAPEGTTAEAAAAKEWANTGGLIACRRADVLAALAALPHPLRQRPLSAPRVSTSWI
eukprot:m.34309 g.34309  ORF g.34309 m.34309 type:complete len:429 (-) comp10684_c0_seq1:45-1331(-)